MNNSFPIFKKSNRLINPTKGNILFLIMVIFIIIITQLEPTQNYIRYPAFLSILVYFIYHKTEFTRYKYLNGSLNGTLIFNETDVIVNERKIDISEVQNAYLRVDDYEDKQEEYLSRGYFSTPKSNGTDNLLTLNLKTGEIIKTFFQIEYETQIEVMKPFVISLLKNNIVNFDRACEFLNLGEDYEIELLQKELNKKEPE